MVEKIVRQTTKQAWYRWSIYVNIILFLIVIIFLVMLILDSITYGRLGGDAWMLITRDVGFIIAALAFIFYQFFRNIMTIIRRTL